MNGTITKRPLKNGGHSWGYTFFAGRDEAGKRIQITKSGFDTKREAADALRQAIAQHQAGAAVLKDARTFAAFFDEWMTEHVARHCSPKTQERYCELGAYALRYFGAVQIQKLTPMIVEKAVNDLLDRGGRPSTDSPNGSPLSPNTVRNIAFVVNGALSLAVRWGLLQTNPMDRVTLPKHDKHEPTVLDRSKIERLFKAATGTRLYTLLVVAAATGCRRGELLALTWADVDFKTGVLSVSKSLEETKKGLRVKTTKSGKPRRFALPGQALEVLQDHRREQDRDRALFGPDYEENDLVFCRPEGRYYKPDKVGARVTELAAKAGLVGVGLH
jgi:integrase